VKFLYFLGQGTAEVLFKDFFYQSSDKIALGGWVINAGREEPSLLCNSSGVRSAVGAERVQQSGGDGSVPLP